MLRAVLAMPLFKFFTILTAGVISYRSDQKEVDQLEAQVQYNAARGNDKEVEKIRKKISDIWEAARKEVFQDMK